MRALNAVGSKLAAYTSVALSEALQIAHWVGYRTTVSVTVALTSVIAQSPLPYVPFGSLSSAKLSDSTDPITTAELVGTDMGGGVGATTAFARGLALPPRSGWL